MRQLIGTSSNATATVKAIRVRFATQNSHRSPFNFGNKMDLDYQKVTILGSEQPSLPIPLPKQIN